jgi:hypothetical protein
VAKGNGCFVDYTDTEQVCKILAIVPIGITASKRKMLYIFIKMQYKRL